MDIEFEEFPHMELLLVRVKMRISIGDIEAFTQA